MKKFLTKKFIISFLIYTAVVKFATVVAWEVMWEDNFDAWFNTETMTVERQVKAPTTIDGMIDEMAKDYLKTPEALEWAKQEVTKDTVEELSKL